MPPSVDDTLTRDADGRVQSIDVDGLMATVEGLGTKAPVRAAFAAEYRHDIEKPKQAEKHRTRASILSKDAWLDDQSDDDQATRGLDDDAGPEPQRSQTRRRWPLFIALGVIAVLCVAGLALT